MNVLSSYASYISGYLPEKVKDAAGLSRQINEDVRHITWLSVERVFWPQDTVGVFLVLGYSDGFQIWDAQDPTGAREILSKQDKAVVLARLLPAPLEGNVEDERALGVAHTPMLAYLHRGAPALVRLFSLRAHDDVHLLRLTEPAKALQASRRFFAVGLQRQVELYDALHFQALFTVQCAGACPTFALGHRWLAYNLLPQQSASGLGVGSFFSGSAGGRLPLMVKEGLQYLGQVGQRTLDHMLMPPPEGTEQSTAPPAVHCGIVAVRDASSRAVISQFDDHAEPVEMMAWDPSGLQLVTCAALGHRVLVHRALLGAEHALMMHDSVQGGVALGGVVFQHVYTLSRGYTPAVISDIIVSDDGQQVAVSSAKGTTHVFHLPPLHSAALGHQLTETGAVRLAPVAVPRAAAPGVEPPRGAGFNLVGSAAAPPKPIHLNATTRVKLGSVLLQEGLMPNCGFLGTASGSRRPSAPSPAACASRMCVATRAGTVAFYSLSPSAPSDAGSTSAARTSGAAADGVARATSEPSEGQAVLQKEVHICRQLRHFVERRWSPSDLDAAPSPQSPRAASPAAMSSRSSPVLGPRDRRSSPTLGPHSNPMAASPRLGPRAASPFARAASPFGRGSRAASPARGTSEDGSASSTAAEHSKWLSQVETATHVPMEVALWQCPQLLFHTYPTSADTADINEALRAGKNIAGCKTLEVSRPERPSDRVQYDAISDTSKEQLSMLFVGALGSTVDAGVREGPSATGSRRGPAVTLAPAWGAIGEHTGGSLEQIDGIGSGLEDLEEDWLKT